MGDLENGLEDMIKKYKEMVIHVVMATITLMGTLSVRDEKDDFDPIAYLEEKIKAAKSMQEIKE